MVGKIIGGKRCSGKTTELIKKASAEHLYILCANKSMAKIIFNQAKDMGLDIPFPITIDDFPLRNPNIKELLIDEVEMVLQQLIGKRVAEMSTSYQLEEPPSLRREDNLKEIEGLTVDIDAREANPPLSHGLYRTSKEAFGIRDEILNRDLKHCKALTPEQVDTIIDLYNVVKGDGENGKDQYGKPLLVIELQDETSVPKVFYKGEEVKYKANILFEWDTSDERSPGGMTYAIDHYEEGKGQLVRNRIERSFRDHA